MTRETRIAEDIAEVLASVADEMGRAEVRGRAAQYIPGLAAISTEHFGVAVALPSGAVLTGGEADHQSTIQSVSKVFSLALALGKRGGTLFHRVGREPSGLAFDSILQLEHERGIPRNPFINAGALVVTDSILSGEPRECLGEMLRFFRMVADDEGIHIDHRIAHSEKETAYRNHALANYLKSCGNLENDVDRVVGTYIHQCAISMSCRQLAKAGRFLAFAGRLGPGGTPVVSARQARRINAVMMTCGHYNGSGEFAYRVGVPGKSGVSGMILAVVPGVASLAVWSPGLDDNGNSLLGTLALEQIVTRLRWSVFL